MVASAMAMATTMTTMATPPSVATASPTGASTSTHFVDEKVKSLCFLKDVSTSGGHADTNGNSTGNDDGHGHATGAADADQRMETLPLLAVGGWDRGARSSIALYLPVVATVDEEALRREFAPSTAARRGSGGHGHAMTGIRSELTAVGAVAHDGDVNALRFVSANGANRLFSASSTGAIHAYSVGEGGAALTGLALPAWASLFRGAATCLDVSRHRSLLVAASERGELAWLRLDEGTTSGTQLVRNESASALAVHGIKVLARESVVATVGAAPGSQLRLWDLSANTRFPVVSASDPQATSVLRSIETHPTRPELLLTGSDDGRVSFWDQRRLDTPFRVEARHQKAVHALAVHPSSPQFLFTGGADANVLSWDFHHGRSRNEAVEYAQHGGSGASSSSSMSGLRVAPLANGFLPWNAIDVHADSDTLVAGSDAQSLLLVRRASHTHAALAGASPWA